MTEARIFDEDDLNDTPETAPPIPKSQKSIDAAKARELRDSPQFKKMREDFRAEGARQRNPDGSVGAPCWLCFGPDTLVRTIGGYVPIGNVAPGAQVLSSDGTWQTVVRTFQRQFAGDALALKTSSMTRSIIVTPEHPILGLYAEHAHGAALFTDENGPFCSPGYCQPRSWAVGPHGHQRKVPNVDQNMRGRLHELRWLPAQQLKTRSWVATAAPVAEEDLAEISIPRVPHRKGPVTFELTDEFLWMLGLYIAEGSCSARHLTFTLHQDELDYQQRIIDLFTSLGFTASRMPTGAPGSKGVRIHVSSTNLAQWFARWIGVGCQNKRIPEELMRLPHKRAQHLVRGVYDGDGCRETLGQTSEVLALQIIELAARSEVMATCYAELHPAPTPSGQPRKPVYNVRWPAAERQSRRWRFHGNSLAQVRECSEVPYAGPVYNLEVTGNNTYVVQNIAVHNCGGDIDYALKYPHPFSWSLDHAVTVKERPDLLMDRENFRHSHHDCNQIRGTDEPSIDIGKPTESW